jgi:hypothetical protein
MVQRDRERGRQQLDVVVSWAGQLARAGIAR